MAGVDGEFSIKGRKFTRRGAARRSAMAGVAEALGGTVPPPIVHPHWQGSVPSKWMDASTGRLRGTMRIPTSLREGTDGIARQGLGRYAQDVGVRRAEECLEGRCKSASTGNLRTSLHTWDHGKEHIWKPCRRVCEKPVINEPDLLSKRVPFVPRHGQFVRSKQAEGLPPLYDPEADNFRQRMVERAAGRRRTTAMMEDQSDQNMVRDLEAWERSHGAGTAGSSAATRISKQPESRVDLSLLSHAAPKKSPPRRSSSDARLEFCRSLEYEFVRSKQAEGFPPLFVPDADTFRQTMNERTAQRQRAKAMEETESDRQMVMDLDAWQRRAC